MLIGVDFDNTIAKYDAVFVSAAVSAGLLESGVAGTKLEVRDLLRTRNDGETAWMRLQGRVYGAHMSEASLANGVGDFFGRCRKLGIGLCIISHKTKFGHFDPDRINLRDATSAWMESKGFFEPDGYGFGRDDIFYESSREDKVNRIAEVGCTHFIDDLEEIFLAPGFPADTARLLYAPDVKHSLTDAFQAYNAWSEISDALLGHIG